MLELILECDVGEVATEGVLTCLDPFLIKFSIQLQERVGFIFSVLDLFVICNPWI